MAWKKRLNTPSITASEFARSGITSGSGRLAIEPKQLVLLDVGYFLDNLLPPFQGEKRVVFLAILAVARMVIWMTVVVFWFYGISTSVGHSMPNTVYTYI